MWDYAPGLIPPLPALREQGFTVRSSIRAGSMENVENHSSFVLQPRSTRRGRTRDDVLRGNPDARRPCHTGLSVCALREVVVVTPTVSGWFGPSRRKPV